MAMKQMTKDEIVAAGERIYQQRLRQLLEPGHHGEFVVIDVETGAYDVDRDDVAVLQRAAAKWPGASMYATRVGMGAFAKMGGGRIASK